MHEVSSLMIRCKATIRAYARWVNVFSIAAIPFGLVAPLFEQARVCANHLSGHGAAEYVTLPTATKLKVTGINLFSAGVFLGDENSESIHVTDPALVTYQPSLYIF